MMRRTFARLEVSSHSIYAMVEPGSCFAGSLLELALAADRAYMLDSQHLWLSHMNFGSLTMANVFASGCPIQPGPKRVGCPANSDRHPLSAAQALDAGLVTFAPDELDWADEIRQAVESRCALSPDALTGMEANLRFGNHETMWSRIFGRLSAWQNWIFIRPNAVGAAGALKVYGTAIAQIRLGARIQQSTTRSTSRITSTWPMTSAAARAGAVAARVPELVGRNGSE